MNDHKQSCDKRQQDRGKKPEVKTHGFPEDFIEFSSEEIEQSIPEYFENIAEKYSDRVAIKTNDLSLTYDQLNRSTNRLGRMILERAGEGPDPVVFILEHGAMPVITLLSILKAGKIYCAIDPANPPSRISLIIKEALPCLLITDQKNLALVKEASNGKIPILLIEDASDQYSDKNICLVIAPDASAGIFFTSGSSGRPKGAIQNHRNILHFAMLAHNAYKMCPDDCQAYFFFAGFAWSINSIFGTLLSGAMLCPVDPKKIGASGLGKWLYDEKITIIQTITSLFQQFVESLDDNAYENFPNLRLIVIGGEPVSKQHVEPWKKHFSDKCLLLNALGSTEASIVSLFFVDKNTEYDDRNLPVGYALPDKHIRLLDENGNDVKPGETGEMAIKSRYLITGYWRNPKLTSSVFICDPDNRDVRTYMTGDLARMSQDGCIELLGRKDFQIKIRGYTVQPAEIETALLEIEGVNQVVIIGHTYPLSGFLPSDSAQNTRIDSTGSVQKLVAYLAVDRTVLPSTDEIRKHLNSIFPDYMVPSVFVILDTLPLTLNGKIDRKKLPEPDMERPQLNTVFISARNETEATITSICEEMLNIRPIGIKDSFYDLGIDSISYFHLILETEKRLGKRFPIDRLLKITTAEGLANVLYGETSALFANVKDSSKVRHFNLVYQSLSELLRSCFKPWNFFRTMVSKTGIVMFTYPSVIKLLSWVCGKNWVQRIFFRKRVDILRRFLAEIKSAGVEKDIITMSILENYFRFWICGSLARSTAPEFDRWVSVTGLETLQQSLRKGRGLVLVFSHTTLAYLAPIILKRNGFENILSLATTYKPEVAKIIGLTESDQVILTSDKDDRFFFRQLSVAKKKLEEGGILYIAGDGHQGDSGINISFLGRNKKFRSGFAELAVNTGADAISVFASMDHAGRINVEFLDPLNKDMPEISHPEKVGYLIRQYANLLEKRWKDDPGSIRWNRITKFLSLSKAEG